MSESLSYNIYALLNEASTNDTSRPASVLIQAGSVPVTISSNSGSATIATKFTNVLGAVAIAFEGSAIPTAFWLNASQPSSGNVTLQVRATVANGTYTLRYLLFGTRD